MDARAFDYCKFPSRHVTEGSSRAPHCARAIPRVSQTMCALGAGKARNRDRAPVPRALKTVKPDWDQEVVCAVAHPISTKGEGLECSRARDGAMVKVVGMTRLQLRGPAHARGFCVGHDGPEAPRGTQPGTIDLGDLGDLGVRKAKFAMRRALGNDAGGAVVHAGSRAEVVGYADI